MLFENTFKYAFISIASVLTVSATARADWWPFSQQLSPEHLEFKNVVEQTNGAINMLTEMLKEQAETATNRVKTANARYKMSWNNIITDFNIETRDKEYFLYLDAPGIHRNEIGIYSDQSTIHVEGEHSCKESADYMPWREDPKTCVKRKVDSTITMPRDADLEKIQILMEDGVVKIRVPRNGQSIKMIQLQERWNDITEKVGEMVENVSGVVENVAESVVDKAKEYVAEAQEMVQESMENMGGKVRHAAANHIDIGAKPVANHDTKNKHDL